MKLGKWWSEWFCQALNDDTIDPEMASRLLLPEGEYVGTVKSIQEPKEMKSRDFMFHIFARVEIEGHLKLVSLGFGNLIITHLIYKTLAPNIIGRSLLIRCKHKKWGPNDAEMKTYEQFTIKEWY